MERECSRLTAQENRQQTRIVIHIANRGAPLPIRQKEEPSLRTAQDKMRCSRFYERRKRRRATPAALSRPVPNRTRVEGSGVAATGVSEKVPTPKPPLLPLTISLLVLPGVMSVE